MIAHDRLERIIKWYKDPEKKELLKSDEEFHDRMIRIDGLIRTGKRDSTIVAIVMKEFLVSRATAHNDIQATRHFFGTITKPEKEFERQMEIERLNQLLAIAVRQGDMRAAAALMGHVIKIKGLDKELPEMPDFSQFEMHQYLMPLMIGDKVEILNLDRPEDIAAATRKLLEAQLSASTLSFKEKMKMLEEPDTEDADAEIIN